MHGIQIWHVLFKIPRKDKNEAWDNRAHRREMEGSSILRPTITRIISWEKTNEKCKGCQRGAASFAFLLFSSFVISSLFLSSIKTPPPPLSFCLFLLLPSALSLSLSLISLGFRPSSAQGLYLSLILVLYRSCKRSGLFISSYWEFFAF